MSVLKAMAILPDNIVNKIMTYVSHPVADLFKEHVFFFKRIDFDRNDVCIRTYENTNTYVEHGWTKKKYECLHYSTKIDQIVIMNKIVNIMIKADIDYALENPAFAAHKATIEMDQIYRHCNRNLIYT